MNIAGHSSRCWAVPGMAPLSWVWRGVSGRGTAGPGSSPLGMAPLLLAVHGVVRLGLARLVPSGQGTAPLGAIWRGSSRLGRTRLVRACHGSSRLFFPGLGKASLLFELEEVRDHLLLAIAAIHSGDEDTAAREIKSAGSLMRAAVEEMRA